VFFTAGDTKIKAQAGMYKYFSLLVLLFVQAKTIAQPGVVISNTSQLEYVEKNIYYLQDSTGNLSFNVVSKMPDSAFVFQPTSTMSFGNSHVVWWFKFYLSNKTDEQLYLLFKNQQIKEFDLYYVQENGYTDSVFGGVLRPFANRFFNTGLPVFNLGHLPSVVYLRVQTPGFYLPMQVGTLKPVVHQIHLLDITIFFIIGILAALALYNLVIWLFVKDIVHLYYFGYIISSAWLAFRSRGYAFELFPSISQPWERNLNGVIVVVFSYLFSITYLGSKKRVPTLHNIFTAIIILAVMMLPTDFIVYKAWHHNFYQLLYILLMPFMIILGIVVYRKGFKPALFFVLAFGAINGSVVVINLGLSGVLSLNSFLVYHAYHLGAVVEALLLSFAVAYRFNLYKKEAHEKELQLVRERNRIMADLHDDIGASLSSMSIYSDLAGTVIENKPEESKELVNKISGTSKELMERMGDIIWSMKPADEDKYTVEARLKNYCNELLAPKNIVCEFDIDARLAVSITNPEIRKNILLIAKEAINNIAKYSEANKAVILFKQNGKDILLSIRDNGKGYDKEKVKYGNGLLNIQQRCKQLNGYCNITSHDGVLLECFFYAGAIEGKV
jgi:two-component system, sensor histidine kinase LadS